MRKAPPQVLLDAESAVSESEQEPEDDGPIRVERTLSRPGHHTLWASPTERLASVVAVEPL